MHDSIHSERYMLASFKSICVEATDVNMEIYSKYIWNIDEIRLFYCELSSGSVGLKIDKYHVEKFLNTVKQCCMIVEDF